MNLLYIENVVFAKWIKISHFHDNIQIKNRFVDEISELVQKILNKGKAP
jgi:phenylpyruvate tautomerase PptA (4-oxalocrotonate tautomerase family)